MLISSFIVSACDLLGGSGYCSFPRFLWDPLADGSDRVWLSKTEQVRNTDTWSRQKHIRVQESEIWIRHKLHASCTGSPSAAHDDGPVPCFRQDVVYRIICVSEEHGDKFRTQQNINGYVQCTLLYTVWVCMGMYGYVWVCRLVNE